MIMGKRVSSASFHYYRTPHSHIEIGNVDQIGYPETIVQYVSIVAFLFFWFVQCSFQECQKDKPYMFLCV